MDRDRDAATWLEYVSRREVEVTERARAKAARHTYAEAAERVGDDTPTSATPMELPPSDEATTFRWRKEE